ncbi:uncharacterized protein LOC127714171 [Mytilus californianus]|uniref:uncharacterized protein LOC127714171 n=1 Tax=Mytilus californianus TaxID=6549 RepID=UPI002245F313|nr:uncharacterized protein LOC127714171 [Mytilus californianus]
MKMKTVLQRTMVLIILCYVIQEHTTTAVTDTDCKGGGIFEKSLRVHQLLKQVHTDGDVVARTFYTEYVNKNDKSKELEQKIFDSLKFEFDVASCIFKGVATVGGIENAVIYVHTTKYVFMSLRYTLDLFSKMNGLGKMEKDLSLFATVLNSVLLYGKKDPKHSETYSGETFMCGDLKKLPVKEHVVFHTFMPSSEKREIAIQYAVKKGHTSCVYIFKNDQHSSKYSPRSISALSYDPKDKEVVFPIGATFQKIECTSADTQPFNSVTHSGIVCLDLISDKNRKELMSKQYKPAEISTEQNNCIQSDKP